MNRNELTLETLPNELKAHIIFLTNNIELCLTAGLFKEALIICKRQPDPLEYAVTLDNFKLFKMLIKEGFKVDSSNIGNLLRIASENQRWNTVKYLLNTDLIFSRHNYKMEILVQNMADLAFIHFQPQILDFLASKGFDINANFGKARLEPLSERAVLHGNLNMTKWCIEQRFLNIHSVLAMSVYFGKLELIEYTVSKGALISIEDVVFPHWMSFSKRLYINGILHWNHDPTINWLKEIVWF
jgi:hypothetical protein